MSDTHRICPHCQHKNPVDAVLCVKCQLRMDVQPDTVNIVDTGNRPSIFNPGSRHLGTKLFLHIIDGESIEVDLQPNQQYVLGRLNTRTGERTAIDLTDHKAEEKGVSRSHARFDFTDDRLWVYDLNSANHTYINNQIVGDKQPRLVRDGDEIRLGGMVMKVQFGSQEEDLF